VIRMVLANQGGHVLGERPVTAVGKGDDRGLAAVPARDHIQAAPCRQAGLVDREDAVHQATASTLAKRPRPPSRAARGRTGRHTPRLLLANRPAPPARRAPPLPASETANSSLTRAPNSSFALPNRILASWSYPPWLLAQPEQQQPNLVRAT
jgi:hypothetical protein